MRRYWIDTTSKLDIGSTIEISGDNYHHIIDVCRQSVGSKFEIITKDSNAYFIEITQLTKKSFNAKVLEARIIPPLKFPRLHLVVSLPKFSTFELILEKSAELGVKSIQPVFSEHSFVRTDSKLSDKKEERWEKIIKSATQQSGRGDLLEIKECVHLKNFITQLKNFDPKSNLAVFAYEGTSELSLKEYLLKQEHEEIKNIWIIVGSEGGFSKEEVDLFLDNGIRSLTLGSQVLRVETACIALISAVKYEFNLFH